VAAARLVRLVIRLPRVQVWIPSVRTRVPASFPVSLLHFYFFSSALMNYNFTFEVMKRLKHATPVYLEASTQLYRKCTGTNGQYEVCGDGNVICYTCHLKVNHKVVTSTQSNHANQCKKYIFPTPCIPSDLVIVCRTEDPKQNSFPMRHFRSSMAAACKAAAS
jgi:hypothetical protein